MPVIAQIEQPKTEKNVLIIHADDQFRSTNIEIDKNIYSIFKNSSNLSISIYSEYLENMILRCWRTIVRETSKI
jgi:hypothetical protein